MRMIEADKVIPLVRLLLLFHPNAERIVEDMQAVVDSHTIEAEPVRHGRWEQWKPKCIGMEYSYDTMVCSVCEFKMGNAKIIPAHYCPNCGAKMDGDDDATN